MKSTTGYYYDCSDVDLLHQWVIERQEVETSLWEMVNCNYTYVEVEENQPA